MFSLTSAEWLPCHLKVQIQSFIRTKYGANNAQFSTLHFTAPFLSYYNRNHTSSKLETDTRLWGTDPAVAYSPLPSATTTTALVTGCLYHLVRNSMIKLITYHKIRILSTKQNKHHEYRHPFWFQQPLHVYKHLYKKGARHKKAPVPHKQMWIYWFAFVVANVHQCLPAIVSKLLARDTKQNLDKDSW